MLTVWSVFVMEIIIIVNFFWISLYGGAIIMGLTVLDTAHAQNKKAKPLLC